MSEIRFSRGVGLQQLMVRGAGVMLVVTAFVLLGDVLAVAGPLAPLAIFLALLLLLLNLLGYVELALSGPRPGGAYVVVEETENGAIGFITGWALTLSTLGLCGLLAQGFGVQVTALLHDHLNLVLPSWPWAIGLVLFLAVNNAVGTKEGQRGLLTALLLLLAVLFVIIFLAVPHIELAHYRAE